VAVFDAEARWSRSVALLDACAVAVAVGADQWWAGGSSGVLHAGPGEPGAARLAVGAIQAPRWDNHWQVWSG
jgi:hypothetical protein